MNIGSQFEFENIKDITHTVYQQVQYSSSETQRKSICPFMLTDGIVLHNYWLAHICWTLYCDTSCVFIHLSTWTRLSWITLNEFQVPYCSSKLLLGGGAPSYCFWALSVLSTHMTVDHLITASLHLKKTQDWSSNGDECAYRQEVILSSMFRVIIIWLWTPKRECGESLVSGFWVHTSQKTSHGHCVPLKQSVLPVHPEWLKAFWCFCTAAPFKASSLTTCWHDMETTPQQIRTLQSHKPSQKINNTQLPALEDMCILHCLQKVHCILKDSSHQLFEHLHSSKCYRCIRACSA